MVTHSSLHHLLVEVAVRWNKAPRQPVNATPKPDRDVNLDLEGPSVRARGRACLAGHPVTYSDNHLHGGPDLTTTEPELEGHPKASGSSDPHGSQRSDYSKGPPNTAGAASAAEGAIERRQKEQDDNHLHGGPDLATTARA